MLILDVPPALPSEVPVLMGQASSGANGNVVMQDLTPRHVSLKNHAALHSHQ